MKLSQKPNIILITTDQQRIDTLRSYGSKFMHTPNLDKLADNGVRFTRAYCPNTVCTPSRVSLMTGTHISRHGSYNIGTYVQNQSNLLSNLLKENGYYNYHIGKAHWNPWGELNEETAEVELSGEPFKDVFGFHQAEFSLGHGHTGADRGHYAQWLKQKGFTADQFAYHPLFEDDPMETGDWDIPLSLHSGAWVVERAKKVLSEISAEQPFFLNLGFQDPHHPHVLPSEFTNRVDEKDVPMNTNPAEDEGLCEHIVALQNGTINKSRFVGEFDVAGNGDDVNWKEYFQDEEKARKTKAYYYSMVQLLDEQIGELVEHIEAQGLLDNTIIIFTSDHGEMLGDHDIGQKGPLVYDEVARIPLIIHYPKEVSSIIVDECVSLVDVLPTLVDYSNIEDPVQRDGISLKSRLNDNLPIERNGVRIEYKEEKNRIRFKCWVTQEWKLAIYSGEQFGELYDLKNDPGERINLYDDEDYRDIKLMLYKELLEDMERSEPISSRPSRV